MFHLGLYYGVCFLAVYAAGGFQTIKKIIRSFSPPLWIPLILLPILSCALVVYWIRQNQWVYFWDSAGYWIRSIRLNGVIWQRSISESLHALRSSINQGDYNDYLATLLALPFRFLGPSYAGFAACVWLTFLLPACFLSALSLTAVTLSRDDQAAGLFIFYLAASLMMPAAYIVLLQGYSDPGFLPPMAALVFLLLTTDFSNGKENLLRDVSLASLMVISWIARRHVIFFIIGFVAAMVLKATVQCVLSRTAVGYRNAIVHFTAVGVLSLGFLLVFVPRFVVHALMTDYKSMYSAYDAPLTEKLGSMVSSFGGLLFFAAGVSALLCFVHRRNRLNAVSILILLFTESALFLHIQSMGAQHSLLLSIPLFVLLFLSAGPQDLPRPSSAAVFLRHAAAPIACMLFIILCFANSLLPNAASVTGPPSALFPTRYSPLYRDDLDALAQIKDILNGLTENTDKSIYMSASGSLFNQPTIQNQDLPDSMQAVPHLMPTNDVDLRDGFPSQFFKADYVLSAEPVQTHLSSGQNVISFLAEEIRDPTSPVGRHFALISTVSITEGIQATIYEKMSDFTLEDYLYINDYFSRLYPGHEELFRDRILN